MTIRREERLDRQALDDGDPDTEVFIGTAEADVYHERRDCPHADDPKPVTRAGAQRRWLAPCRACCLDGGGSP